ncbi:MAG TPA: phasin family protein [Casimicrobiaceae bacterium]|nr:phasin family protein [Casimicrobiaceae bacterium]
MARKTAAGPASQASARKSAARRPRTRSGPPPAGAAAQKSAGASAKDGPFPMGAMPNVKVMTPEQAIDLYKANAKLALDIINATIENTARLRKKQFEGEETARELGQKAARSAAQASDPQALMAAGQGVAQEALEKSMRYWGEMFDLIVEIQKRLYTMIEEQTEGMPGVKQAKAAMALMPDLRQMQKVVTAMQGVVSSGGTAFETMQRVMGDFAKMTQQSMPGGRR